MNCNLPLSEELRPQKLEEVVGQEEAISWIRKRIQENKPLSVLLYGPPGTGKTTLARIYAKSLSLPFYPFSAVNTSLSELKKLIQETAETPLFTRKIVLFIDEIHRFNKLQQDFFLPLLEDGSILLVGATTENPSFALNNALLSRLHTLTLFSLPKKDLEKILDRYEKKAKTVLSEETKKLLVESAGGDARFLCNLLESKGTFLAKKVNYDRDGDFHYQLISALHKSVRGSDPDAALYYLCRMLIGGEDPLYLARRLIRMAVEDIGLADPNALTVTLQARKSYHILGSPEGELALAEAVLYLALAPKSNSVYEAFTKMKEAAEKTANLPPPKSLINAPTKWMQKEGYGKNYIYEPEEKLGVSNQRFFPEEMEALSFYSPKEVGFEREMKKRKSYFENLKKKLQSS